MTLYLGLAVLGYVIGSIPVAFVVTHMLLRQDIRTIGSGNVGATNAYRALGWRWAIVVFLLDAAKGTAFVLLVWALNPFWITPPTPFQLILVTPVLGHCFSVFLRLSGGRGVATAAGVAAALSPWAVLAAGGTYLVVLKLLKKSFLGSISGLLVFVVLELAWFRSLYTVTVLLLAALLVFQHRSHIGKALGSGAS